MKNNTFKRVMAGTLAVLTVASPMTANVGGFLTGSVAIVANAVDASINVTEKTFYSPANATDNVYKWDVGDYFETDTVLSKAQSDTWTYNIILEKDKFKEGDAVLDSNERLDNVKMVQYVTKLNNTQVVNQLKITTIDDSGDTPRDITRTFTMANGAEDYLIRVADVDDTSEANTNTILLTTEKLAETYDFDFTDAKQYIKSISYTANNGSVNLTGNAVTSHFGKITADSMTQITIVSTALLTSDAIVVGGTEITPDDFLKNKYTPTYANGEYTYVINVAREYKLNTIENEYALDDDAIAALTEDKKAITIKRPTDKDAVDLAKTIVNNPNKKFQAGSTVTLTSGCPFTIANGAIKAQKADGSFETEDVKGIYEDGKFTATFVAADVENPATAVKITRSAMPTKLDYTVDTNKLTATSTGEEAGIVTNAEVASIVATVKTPVYVDNDPTKGFVKEKVNDEWVDKYTETEIPAGGNAAYNKDLNAKVEVAVKLDNNLLYNEGSGYIYKATVTKNGTKVGEIAWDKTPAESAPNGSNNTGLTITQKADGFVIETNDTKQAGTYKVDLSVWGHGDNSEKKLTYTYTVTPAALAATDLTPVAFVGDDDKNKEDFVDAYNELVEAKLAYAADPTAVNYYLAENDEIQQQVELLDKTPYAFVNGGSAISSENIKGVYKTGDSYYVVLTASASSAYSADLSGNTLTFSDGGSVDTSIVTVTTEGDLADKQKAYDDILNRETTITNITKNADNVWEVAVPEKIGAKALINEAGTATAETITFFSIVDPDLAVSELRVNGDDKTTTMNGTPGTATMQVMDANFGGSEKTPKNFEFKWKLVKAAVDDAIFFKDAPAAGYKSKADAAMFEALVKDNLTSTNNIDVSKATFKYTLTQQPNGLIDIDSMTSGLPTTAALKDVLNATNGHNVYVYATVGSLETVVPMTVTITDEVNKQDVNAVLNKLTYTYGEKISWEDLSFVKDGTTTAVSDLTATEDSQINVAIIEAAKTNDGAYKRTNGEYDFTNQGQFNAGNADASATVLKPGIYQITFKQVTNLSADEYYKFKAAEETRTYVIEVKKRTLESYMVATPEKEITGGEARLVAGDFAGTDVDGGYFDNTSAAKTMTFAISGKQTSSTTPGQFVVSVKPSGTTAEYYEGEVDVTWFATGKKNVASSVISLAFNTDNNNIYKDANGVQIHVEACMMKNRDEILTNDDFNRLTSKTLNGKDNTPVFGVAEYGFLYEKAGALAEYEDTTEGRHEAAQKMRLGQPGILKRSGTTGNMKDKDGNALLAMLGINSVVKSIDDYIWLRPYLLTTDGEIVYGEPQRFDFQKVAQEAIDPQIDEKHCDLVQKDGTIYDYIYAFKRTKNDAEFGGVIGKDRTAVPDAFGVVISRTGNYAPMDDTIVDWDEFKTAITNLYSAFDNNKKWQDAADALTDNETGAGAIANKDFVEIDKQVKAMIAAGKTEIDLKTGTAADAAADAVKALQVAYNDSGVQKLTEEYVNVADKLSLETADVKSTASATNKFYDKDECGTLSRIPDSLSNVYVRTYVDFGEGLVVYSAPRAIESASAQIQRKTAFGFGVNNNLSVEKQTGEAYQMIAHRTEDEVILKEKMSNLNPKSGKPQEFEAITINTTGKTDEAKKNQATAFGLVIDKNGTVTTEGNTKNLVKGEGFDEYTSSKPNADTVTGADTLGNNYATNGRVDFGAVTTIKGNAVTARAFVELKGVVFYSKPVTSGFGGNAAQIYTQEQIVKQGEND